MTKPNLELYYLNVLRFVNDDKLYCDSKTIAQHLHASPAFGTKVANQMGRAGLLKWLPDVCAWRVSELGRQQLTQQLSDQN